MNAYDALSDDARDAIEALEIAAYRQLQDDDPDAAKRALTEAREVLASFILGASR